jgi:hypothetical protein
MTTAFAVYEKNTNGGETFKFNVNTPNDTRLSDWEKRAVLNVQASKQRQQVRWAVAYPVRAY